VWQQGKAKAKISLYLRAFQKAARRSNSTWNCLSQVNFLLENETDAYTEICKRHIRGPLGVKIGENASNSFWESHGAHHNKIHCKV
jgi:hypothetical protein